MEFLERMNLAVDYIEGHLTEDIDYRELAHRVGCSEYHLSRMFPFITGLGLGQYVRRRKMTQAALELQGSEDLLTLAVKYGYSSVAAFTRAFHEVHGVSPRAFRQQHEAVRLFPKLSFTIAIKGVISMVYRLLEKPAFRLVGTKKTVGLVYSGPNPEIDAQWKGLTMPDIVRWKQLSNTEPQGLISASTNFSEGRMEGGGTLDHYIGAATTSAAPAGDDVLEVEGGTWAVFEARGNFPHTLQETWGRIYSEWFPASSYELRGGPEILWNEGPDTTKPDFRSEIWIPVAKSNARV